MPIPASRPKAKEPTTATGVNHHLTLTRQASPETGHEDVVSRGEVFLYVLKGGASRRRRPSRCLRPAGPFGPAAAARPANTDHDRLPRVRRSSATTAPRPAHSSAPPRRAAPSRADEHAHRCPRLRPRRQVSPIECQAVYPNRRSSTGRGRQFAPLRGSHPLGPNGLHWTAPAGSAHASIKGRRSRLETTFCRSRDTTGTPHLTEHGTCRPIKLPFPGCLVSRRRPDSNRSKRLCRPLRSHSATAPWAGQG
jgi:hypothetical protein